MIAVLGVDPSSTRTGYAVLQGPATLMEAGYLRPRRSGGPAIERIVEMTRELEDLLDLIVAIERGCPIHAVIEISSGKVNRLRHGGRGAGLAVYGMAVGAMYWAVWAKLGKRCHPVTENEWTSGMPKRRRQQAVARRFPVYAKRMAADGGADVADAIGLALWWFEQ